MPLTTFDERVLNDLEPCKTLSSDLFMQFVQCTFNLLLKGGNPGAEYEILALKASSTVEQVERAIAALSELVLEAEHGKLSQDQFSLFLLNFSLTPEQNKRFVEFYVSKRKAFEEADIFSSFSGKGGAETLPVYLNLRWRLDIALDSRFLKGSLKPSFILELQTTSKTKASEGVPSGTNVVANNMDIRKGDSGTEGRRILLEADYANLRVLDEELDAALAHMESTHCKRIDRNIN